MAPHVPQGVHFVPGHPIAGTEQSGPEAGFAELFDGRWTHPHAGARHRRRGRREAEGVLGGARRQGRDHEPPHHDMVLAITSHLPHLIAYNIVDTAEDLERVTENEVIKFSAGGFRDFTRIAASDPTMWRDVFLNNKEAVLEMLRRFSEDLPELQTGHRSADGDTLFRRFSDARAVRRGIIAAGQERRRRTSAARPAGVRRTPGDREAARANSDGRRARPLDFRLWLADVAAGLCSRGSRPRASRRLAPQLLHLFALSSRVPAPSRPRARARPRRRCEGLAFRVVAGERPRDAALSARTRAGGERLSRGAGAGDAALRRATAR